MALKSTFTLFFACVTWALLAQSAGDTTVVQTWTYASKSSGPGGIRDTVIPFPNDPSKTYERVWMLYNMRCKNGLVSTTSNRNLGCGEWDYSCNTFVHDSARVDSSVATTPEFDFSGYTGTLFPYQLQPAYTIQQSIQTSVQLNAILTEDTAQMGAGLQSSPTPIALLHPSGKSQYLFTQSELLAAGLTAGPVAGLSLQVAGNPGLAKWLRVRMKPTAITVLNPSNPDLSGFTEVYQKNTAFAIGPNRLQFPTPFVWDGLSNIIVEFSFTNKVPGPTMTLQADSMAVLTGIATSDPFAFEFNGSNYGEALNYNGITGSTPRTIEAWIKTTSATQDIVYYGANATGQKYRFWVNGAGQIRVEINGAYIVGTTAVNDGQWHHVAMVQSGSAINSISLYVDGVIESISSISNATINTAGSSPVQITKGVHNTYWKGNIAEVRMWSSALSGAQLQAWMHRRVDATHPAAASLELYYPMNEGSGSTLTDASGNGRHAVVVNDAWWNHQYGEAHFKGFAPSHRRPVVSFFQGTYNQAIVADTVADSTASHGRTIRQYQVFPKPGTVKNDSIGLVQQGYYYLSASDSTFGPNGALVSAPPTTPAGTFAQNNLNYRRRAPGKFEIMSFVTPYGINLDLGMAGETWIFDVTDFLPILQGSKRMTMEFGGQWQEQMDIRFLFVEGTPARNVVDINQIWPVTSQSYAKISTDAAFEPRNVAIPGGGSAYVVRSSITGHGQEGEFIPRQHSFNLNGGAPEFSWQVWKGCGLNPVYPQGGTWIYDRAGWCPGMATDLQRWDITTMVTPGQTALMDYSMATATGTSNYIVSHQLVSYGPPNFTLDAAVEEIVSPTNRVEYRRMGAMCRGPVVRIRNTGATVLTGATITYWLNNTATKETYTWNGALNFMETADLELPVGSLWDGLNGTANNAFHVEISLPNGGQDAYPSNNGMSSAFTLPEVIPAHFYIRFKTNSAAFESSYKLLDEWGNVLFSRSGMTNNTFYNDTFQLGDGCYSLVVDDSGDDGISFWANNDGTGFCRIHNAQSGTLLKTLQPDFGSQARFEFTVNAPLSYEELHPVAEPTVYPNPSKGTFFLEADQPGAEHWVLEVLDVQGRLLKTEHVFSTDRLRHTLEVPGVGPGTYLLRIRTGETLMIQQLLVN